MRTLRNRRRGKRTRRGGLIKKVQNEWTNVSGPSETQAVNDYRRMEEETMRLLASGCQSKDSNECLRDEGDVLLKAYQAKCDAYQGYEDETTFSELLSIKDTIGELIRLRVQDSGRFPVKLTDDAEQRRKRKAHRDRIQYWSIIYSGIKKIFDTVRQKRYDTKIATYQSPKEVLDKEYESSKAALNGEYESLKDPLSDEQYKTIKDAYEQTASLITMLEKEDSLMGNGNEAAIAALKARNVSKQESYEQTIGFLQRKARRVDLEREMEQVRVEYERKMEQLGLKDERKIKELRLEEEEERQRQEREAHMITESISTMDKEQQRQLKEEEAKEAAEAAAKEAAEAAEAARANQAAEKLAVEQAIQKSKEEEIMGQWNFLASISPDAMVSQEATDVMKQYDDHIKQLVQKGFTQENIRQIKEIITTWESFLDSENEKKKATKSPANRAAASVRSEASIRLDAVIDAYKWDDIHELAERLPKTSLLKQQLTEIDFQIDALVSPSGPEIGEMNERVSLLIEKGELLIIRDEMIKLTKKIHSQEEQRVLMRSNRLFDEIPDLPIHEKNVEMKRILSEWETKAVEANIIQTHRENLPPELFQRLIRLKEAKKVIDPEDPRLKVINMHNGLIDKMIYKEPPDIGRITGQLEKWEQV
jgi:hypothetical protein